MGKVEQIESQVSMLSQQELAQFRAWYAAFDADAWDRQLEQDVASGKLDSSIVEAGRKAPSLQKLQQQLVG